jgi:hypothetical protein
VQAASGKSHQTEKSLWREDIGLLCYCSPTLVASRHFLNSEQPYQLSLLLQAN